VRWEMVDLRQVYQHAHGLCGICKQPVSLDTFTVDHIVPTSRGGGHVFGNLQPAHRVCNSRKGNR
jgi:5-methylcytosine-specific restriction endonuclease McrA